MTWHRHGYFMHFHYPHLGSVPAHDLYGYSDVKGNSATRCVTCQRWVNKNMGLEHALEELGVKGEQDVK